MAAVFIPGFAVATLIAPTWRAWQRLAMAPGLSAGVIGVYGLALHDVHLPFEPLTVLPVLAAIALAALVRWRRNDARPATTLPWRLPVTALVAGLVAAGTFFWALHGQALPPDWDAPTHGGLVNAIVHTHDVLPLTPIPLEGSDFVRARPGFEAMAAVVSWLGAPSPAMSMAPIIAATLLVMPLALTLLALETTGSVAFAAVVPLFAIGLAFPSDQAIVGRFPEIVDATLIVPFIVASLRVMRGEWTRQNAILLAAITMSIWAVHGLEVVTAIIVACALFSTTVTKVIRAAPRAALARIGLAACAVLGPAIFVTLLTRIPHLPPTLHVDSPVVVIAATGTPLKLHHILVLIAQTNLVGPVALALFAIGAVAMLIRRRMRWVLIAELVLVLLIADDLYWHRLHRLWDAIYPFGDTDRILGLQYWLVPIVLAFGLFSLVDLMRSLSSTRRRWVVVSIAAVVLAGVAVVARHLLEHLWAVFWEPGSVYVYPLGIVEQLSSLRAAVIPVAIAALAVVVAWVVLVRGARLPDFVRERIATLGVRCDAAGAVLGAIAILAVVVGAAAEHAVYRTEVETRSLVTPADITVLSAMAQALPAGALVLTNGGNDAGMWLSGLTELNALVPDGYSFRSLDLPFESALANACTNPAGAEAELQRTDAVFIGSLHDTAPEFLWNVNCLERLPDLRLIASAPYNGTVAAGFAVIKS